MIEIISPLPGVFYRKPAPDKEPYVEVGGRVEVGDTIGLIEIMKQFAEIKAEKSGVITAFLVEDMATVNPGVAVATLCESP